MPAMNYLYLNPIRKNHCEQIVDWIWSSAKIFERGVVDLVAKPIQTFN